MREAESQQFAEHRGCRRQGLAKRVRPPSCQNPALLGRGGEGKADGQSEEPLKVERNPVLLQCTLLEAVSCSGLL